LRVQAPLPEELSGVLDTLQRGVPTQGRGA